MHLLILSPNALQDEFITAAHLELISTGFCIERCFLLFSQVCKASCLVVLAAETPERCRSPLRSAVRISHSLRRTSSEGPRRGEDNQASFVRKTSGMKGFFKEQKSGGGGWQESPPSQAVFRGMVTGLAAHAGRSELVCEASLGPSPMHGTFQALQALPPRSPAQIPWQDYSWWKSVSVGGMCVPPPCLLLGLSHSKCSPLVHL